MVLDWLEDIVKTGFGAPKGYELLWHAFSHIPASASCTTHSISSHVNYKGIIYCILVLDRMANAPLPPDSVFP